MRKIVAIGGGNGLSNLLSGLVKEKDFDVTAIVSVMDSGGSTGKIRDQYKVFAFGDIRRALVALCPFKSEPTPEVKSLETKSEPTPEVKSLKTSGVDLERLKNKFNYRYKTGAKKGHTCGNLFLLDLFKKYKSEKKAIEKASDILKIKGKVLPVTLQSVNLCADLENGKKIVGEANIDLPKCKNRSKIKKIYLHPKANLNREAGKAIQSSDIIIIGPGDLYTSVLCNFVVDGLSEAVKQSKAKKIWINNLTNKNGETANYKLTDYLEEIDKYIGAGVIDYVLYQRSEVGSRRSEIGSQKLEIRPPTSDLRLPFLVGDDFRKKRGSEFVHNSEKVIKVIKKLIL